MWNAKIRDYPAPLMGTLFLSGTKKSDAPAQQRQPRDDARSRFDTQFWGSDEGARGFARPFFYLS
jgi:hypothetical protein